MRGHAAMDGARMMEVRESTRDTNSDTVAHHPIQIPGGGGDADRVLPRVGGPVLDVRGSGRELVEELVEVSVGHIVV